MLRKIKRIFKRKIKSYFSHKVENKTTVLPEYSQTQAVHHEDALLEVNDILLNEIAEKRIELEKYKII